MSFEGFEEFSQDFVFSLLSSLDIWVVLGIVNSLDIIDLEGSVSVLVEDLEGSLGQTLSEVVHFSSDSSNEFVNRQSS